MYNTKTVINLKTDRDTKIAAQRLAGDLGLSLSAIINAYLKEVVRSKELHFSVTPRMSTGLQQLLGAINSDIKTGKNLSPAISNKDSLKAYLSAL